LLGTITHDFVEAPEEEVKKAKSAAKSKPKVSKEVSKGSVTSPPSQRPVATPVRKGAAPTLEAPEATPTLGASGNPAEKKRHRVKQPDEDKDRQIDELKKARLGVEISQDWVTQYQGITFGCRFFGTIMWWPLKCYQNPSMGYIMVSDVWEAYQWNPVLNCWVSCEAAAKMQQQLEAMAKQPASSHEKYEGDGQQGQVDKGQKKETTLSLEAKMAKLRRVCEKKPSGKVKVPEEVHLKWKQNKGDDRAELLKALEDSNWDKEHVRVQFCRIDVSYECCNRIQKVLTVYMSIWFYWLASFI
jgi:hypothetical protein